MNTNQRDKGLMWCSDFCVDGDNVWMMHGELNAIINYNMRTKVTKLVAIVPDTKMIERALFKRIMKYEQKLILVPGRADYLFVYDLLEEKFVYQKHMRDTDTSYFVCSDACIVENKLYCIPYLCGDSILEFNLDTLCESREINLSDEKCDGNPISKCCLSGTLIYVAIPKSNYLIKYNILTNEVASSEIPDVQGIKGMVAVDNKLYLSCAEETLSVWDIIAEETVSKIKPIATSGYISQLDTDNIWIDTNKTYANIVNIRSGELEKFDKLNQREQLLKLEYVAGGLHILNSVVYYFNRMRSSLMRYDSGKWEEYDIRWSFTEDEEYRKAIRTSGEIIKEDDFLRLLDFIECL